MRSITYAGETVITTDDVAEALVALTAALARAGEAEAVRIPIVFGDREGSGLADLVIGVGNDVLSVPVMWSGDEPDFSEWAEGLRSHHVLPQKASNVIGFPSPQDDWDPDLDGIDRA